MGQPCANAAHRGGGMPAINSSRPVCQIGGLTCFRLLLILILILLRVAGRAGLGSGLRPGAKPDADERLPSLSGRGKGRGRAAPGLSEVGKVTRTPLPFSLTPALSRWEREAIRLQRVVHALNRSSADLPMPSDLTERSLNGLARCLDGLERGQDVLERQLDVLARHLDVLAGHLDGLARHLVVLAQGTDVVAPHLDVFALDLDVFARHLDVFARQLDGVQLKRKHDDRTRQYV